jgi:hypothetical protein
MAFKCASRAGQQQTPEETGGAGGFKLLSIRHPRSAIRQQLEPAVATAELQQLTG